MFFGNLQHGRKNTPEKKKEKKRGSRFQTTQAQSAESPHKHKCANHFSETNRFQAAGLPMGAGALLLMSVNARRIPQLGYFDFPRTGIEGSRTNKPTGKVVCTSFIAQRSQFTETYLRKMRQIETKSTEEKVSWPKKNMRRVWRSLHLE